MNPPDPKELEPLLHEAGWFWLEDKVLGLWLMPAPSAPDPWGAHALKHMLILGGYSCEIYAVRDAAIILLRR
jgi:hypothetical protein